MSKEKTIPTRQERFLTIADQYRGVIAKVCSVYQSDTSPFADLYQEVMINLWVGLETYRGESKMSTWIYRLALNTCISWHRRNSRHSLLANSEPLPDIEDAADDTNAQIKELYRLIGSLGDLDKALIMLWLDEKSYDEISAILGISKANVAIKLHRAKARLSEMAKKSDLR